MASINQPFLQTPHKTNSKSKSKLLFITALSISALLISAVFLLPNLINSSTRNYLYVCRRASNPDACHGFVSEIVSGTTAPPDATALLQEFLINQAHLMRDALSQTKKLKSDKNQTKAEFGPVASCLELLDMSVDLVLDSIKALSHQTRSSHTDAHTYLSAVLTHHVTCYDELEVDSAGRDSLGPVLRDLISRAKASLAMMREISEPDHEMFEYLWGKLPSWITESDRKLMQSKAAAINADLTVAKDGSGHYKKVADAVNAAPDKNDTRFVIYVKAGTYKENVDVRSSKWNLMIVGDGQDSTIITGSLNTEQTKSTFKTATLAVNAKGFMLQDIRIQNTAAPLRENGQAVALRVSADHAVVYRCRIESYQDTLYPHSQRQFYRETYVRGTIDFICGNAAVVLQKCTLEARKPLENQKNMVTAQNRADPLQSTGTTIQDTEIKAGSDLAPHKDEFPTFLGRPWGEYSRTAVMQSYLGDHIDPAGWYEWNGNFALNTLYYGEYNNRGPRADTSKRVDWSGFHRMTTEEARQFTVKELIIKKDDWLRETGVPYIEGLGQDGTN